MSDEAIDQVVEECRANKKRRNKGEGCWKDEAKKRRSRGEVYTGNKGIIP